MTKYKRARMRALINDEPIWVFVVELVSVGVLASLLMGLFK